MQYKKEPCRNFQRGSCQYGDRCKFLHVIQQQPRSNAFGFGTLASSNQQQKPNPFGFGVQSSTQSKGVNNFGNKQNQFKNTWTRSSASSGTPSLRQPDNQPQATNHQCTDPDSCKRIITEDFEQERPLWKLTCYSHRRSAPCDIVGDVSYEELRAAAYDDSKRGLSLQSIVERERNLLNSKLIEFGNLLRNPYTGPAGSTLSQQIPFPGATVTAFSPTAQNSAPAQPPLVSSFSQLGASLNTGFPARPPVQSNNASVQQISFPGAAQASDVFATNNVQTPNAFPFINQLPNQLVAVSSSNNMAHFSNSSAINTSVNQFSTLAVSTLNLSPASTQPPALFNGSNSTSKADGQAAIDLQLRNNLPMKIASGDSSIWLKEKWIPGEIPEEAPPDAYV